MADVITGLQYSALATKLGTVISVVRNSKSYLWDALVLVAGFTDIDPTYDLIVPFKNVYDIQINALQSSSNYLTAVRALNDHVISRAKQPDGTGYSDINDWFDDETDAGRTVSVPQTWADLCVTAGVTIEPAYIH